jgi:arylsulfatase A-like enzyme
MQKISRREFLEKSSQLMAGGAILSGAPQLFANQQQPAHKRPNLLFVFADMMRGQDMGCAGNEQIITPNLDKLAKEGVLLTNAISTFPICCPYRAMLMTSRYPLSNTVVANALELPESELCIAEILKGVGYQTGYIGKWHLNGQESAGEVSRQFIPPGPKRQGFDYWAATNIIHQYFDSYYYRDTDEKIPIKGWEPDTQTDLAIQYMTEHKDAPFCLFLSWGPPHVSWKPPNIPYIAPEKYKKMYKPDKIKLRENVVLAEESARAYYWSYYADITSLDWNMGRLMEAMDKLGIADDTIVVFTSDHGDMLLSLSVFEKQWPYEESIRVPFIIRYPKKIKADRKNDVLLGSPDIMPTLLSLMDVEIPRTVEGRNLSPFILGSATEPEPDSVLIEVIALAGRHQDRVGMNAWRGVRTKRYTYARFREKDFILMDNQLDPYQKRNLVYNTEYNDSKAQLKAKLDEWLKKTNDPFLVETAYPRTEMIHDRPPLWKSEKTNK